LDGEVEGFLVRIAKEERSHFYVQEHQLSNNIPLYLFFGIGNA
jgi:hypothetical protein